MRLCRLGFRALIPLVVTSASLAANPLPNFSARLQAIATGANTRANILIIGDSISGDTMMPLYPTLNTEYGNGGISGGAGQLGLLTQYSAGVAVNSTADFSKWIGGYWNNVPTGQTVTFQKAVSLPVAQSPKPLMTELKVYYLTEPGGGTFSIDTATMTGGGYYPGTFSHLPGYGSISTDGPAGMGVLTIPITPGADLSWRVTGTQGNVKILGGGWTGNAGVHFNYMLSNGGSKLIDYASTPASVWSSFLGEVTPDLVIVSVKDDVTPDFRAAVVAIQNRIYAANPLAETVFVGAYNSRQDDPGYSPAPPTYQTMAAQNAVLQDVVNDPTVPGLNYYWDAGSVIGTWANGNANGWYSDTVHLNDTGRAVLSNAFATDFQLHPQPVPEPASTAVVLALGLGLFVTLRRLRKL